MQIEQKPNKKEELMVANSVLKLAADLLKVINTFMYFLNFIKKYDWPEISLFKPYFCIYLSYLSWGQCCKYF